MENPAHLNEQELTILAKIIEVAQSRGIFAVADLTMIGSIYQRLTEAVAALQNAPAEGDNA